MNLDVDLTSLESINKTINLLKVKRGELQRSINPMLLTRNERNKQIFDACQRIIDTDISNVYNGIILDSKKIYYVYAHLDPSMPIAINRHGVSTFAATLGMKHRPCYIGKGSGNRCFELDRNETHRKIRQRLKSSAVI